MYCRHVQGKDCERRDGRDSHRSNGAQRDKPAAGMVDAELSGDRQYGLFHARQRLGGSHHVHVQHDRLQELAQGGLCVRTRGERHHRPWHHQAAAYGAHAARGGGEGEGAAHNDAWRHHRVQPRGVQAEGGRAPRRAYQETAGRAASRRQALLERQAHTPDDERQGHVRRRPNLRTAAG